MAKQKIGFWQFLFQIGDDYLQFLRNLTPAILFFSLDLFLIQDVNFGLWNLDGIILIFLTLASGFIATSVIVINIVGFMKKIVKTLRRLHQKDVRKEYDTVPDLFRALWKETNAKQLLFFAVVNVAAVLMVLIYGMKYALSMYSSFVSLNS